MPRFRHSASFGKRQEFGAIAELLRRGYDVYVALVDDQGIDCVVRQGPREFYDVQIKARSKESKAGLTAHFPLIDCADPRENFCFLFGGGRGARPLLGYPFHGYREEGFCHDPEVGKEHWEIPAGAEPP